jgi:transcriptional regulator with XRE-family HTH domain
MTTTDMPKVHEGRNVKRFREMLGMKQDALAYELGEDWTQKKISILEQKETIEPDILEQVAKILKVTPEAIRNFNEEAAFNFINNFNDNSINHGPLNNYHCTFNPLDKVVELYERMLKEKNELIEKLAGEKKK